MDSIFIMLIVGFALALIGWVGYSTITESIIKDQEREIAKLKTQINNKNTRR